MKILIAGGGTGGHLYPAIALASELKREDKSIDILFIGNKGKMEEKIVPLYGFEIKTLRMLGFSGNVFKKIWAIILVIWNTLKIFLLIKKKGINAVICFGGYESVPAGIAACMHRIPLFLQEQNVLWGRALRFLSKFAKRIYCGVPPMGYLTNSNILVSGNPIRVFNENFKKLDDFINFYKVPQGIKKVLILGGSLGARALNDITYKIITGRISPAFFIWISGKFYYEEFVKKLKDLIQEKGNEWVRGENFLLFSFFDEIWILYRIVDLVVSRAGGIALSEIIHYKKPSIIVPSPNVSENHQMYNALYYLKRGFIYLLPESRINTLPQIIEDFLNSGEIWTKIQKRLNEELPNQSASKITKDILTFLRKGNNH